MRRERANAPTRSLFDSSAVGIELTGLSKTFPGSSSPAVSSLDLEVTPGSIVVLVGPSGCGKTTTLKMINRLVEPSAGTITIGGVDARSLPAHELRRHIGYVIQQTGLFPHLTIAANIATVPRLLGWSKEQIRDRVEELVEVVGLDSELLGRYPPELSGGQQQRVGVARALAADPPVLLMDEPYSAVDPIVRTRLQDELLDLQSRVGKTIVLVTHDIDEAIKVGDRIALLNVGGVLEQYAPPAEMLRNPANAFVEDFLGQDRALKRLSLVIVDDIEVGRGPVVDEGASVDRARAVMAEHRTDWVGVLSGERILGWVGAADLNGCARAGDADAREFRSVIDGSTTLRDALDAIVSSHIEVAVVIDAGRYVGMLTLESVRVGALS
ncbi:MAG: ABC transporter ATP-binding protein [Acidimicrobiales bacterium]